jgi:hypothetical protein
MRSYPNKDGGITVSIWIQQRRNIEPIRIPKRRRSMSKEDLLLRLPVRACSVEKSPTTLFYFAQNCRRRFSVLICGSP